MSILDIIVICVLALFTFIGFIKGFLNTLLSLFGNLASLAIAIVIVKPCARFFNSIFHLVDKFGNLIVNGLQGSNLIPTLTEPTAASDVVTMMRSSGNLVGKFASLFVDKDIMYGEGATDLTATLSKNMGSFATSVFTVIIMFVVIRLAVFFLSRIFDAITKKRALSGLDRLLGLAFGFCKGALLVTFVLSVFYTLSPIIPIFDEWIANSGFTNWLYGYVNQLINWLVNTIDWKSLGMLA